MRALYVTSEVYPLAKTGGLADVSAALPAALRAMDIDVRILLPGYRQALELAPGLREVARFGDLLGYGETRLLETHLPDSAVPVWLVDCPNLYNRPGGLYQDEDGRDWVDNDLRFGLLNHVAAAVAANGDWRPDIIHANDWHAGLIPLVMPATQRPPTIFTIHNLAYQGIFKMDALERLGLSAQLRPALEHFGQMSFLKAGIHSADAITTVSPTYAKEILTPEYGCGLDDLLRHRASGLTGILNGIDDKVWDPATNPYLAANYSMQSVARKSACKRAVQKQFGLDDIADTPLIVFMSRLVHQKMPDIVLEALPALLEDDMQFVLIAEGDSDYQERFQQLAARYPKQIGVRIGYREDLAHQLLAGGDMLLHPSRFEPCGLVPIYAMRYGTLPLVRRSGGLTDSVKDTSPETMRQGTATGFSFDNPSLNDVVSCARRACALYRQPIHWRKLQMNAMRQDFSWRRSANAYADLYKSLSYSSADDATQELTRICA